jgi:hypothetical protein
MQATVVWSLGVCAAGPTGHLDSAVTGDDEYGGWFRDLPAEQLPEWAREQAADARRRGAWEVWAVDRAAELQAALPEREGRRTPCAAVGVLVDLHGERYGIIAISGDGYLPKAIADRHHPEELVAEHLEEGLHAEQRLARTAAWMRAENAAQIMKGNAPVYPEGVRLESVAAGYPICWTKCQPDLAREGTKPLTRLQSPPPEARQRHNPGPKPQLPQPGSTRKREGGPQR